MCTIGVPRESRSPWELRSPREVRGLDAGLMAAKESGNGIPIEAREAGGRFPQGVEVAMES